MAQQNPDELLFADHQDVTRRPHAAQDERRRQRLLGTLGGLLVAGLGGLWLANGPALPRPAVRAAALSAPANTRAAAQPAALRTCQADDKRRDERVITCRFSERSRADGVPPVEGWIGAGDLAEDRAARVPSRQTPARTLYAERTVESIPGWDGANRYTAQWQSTNNAIDDASVCANYRSGSIDQRECRKAAKVYFRNECRRWAKRTGALAERFRARYCHAAESFSPM